MKLEAIHDLWAEDAIIDKTDVGQAALDIPKLHSKYFKIFSNERLTFKKMEAELNQLKHLKTEYFNGILDEETMKEKGWSPNPLRILKSDIPNYVANDQEVVDASLKLEIQKEKLDLLESIIKTIGNRSFQLNITLGWQKFINGIL